MQNILDKAQSGGVAQLSDGELLQLLLGSKAGGILAQQYTSLFDLLREHRADLCQYAHVTERSFYRLQAVLEITNRYLRAQLEYQGAFSSPKATVNFLTSELGSLEHEVFCCLWLDNQNRLLKSEQLARGSIHSASVYPREVIKAAIKHNAAAVIFAHNHPSGATKPSDADLAITQNLVKALNYIDVRVLDHIIIGHNQHFSFAENCINLSG